MLTHHEATQVLLELGRRADNVTGSVDSSSLGSDNWSCSRSLQHVAHSQDIIFGDPNLIEAHRRTLTRPNPLRIIT